MLISAIVAISQNNVIGRDGHLPWHLSADLKRFKAITTGHSIVLGRKNYDDIGRPLPNRTNYVLTRNAALEAPGCIVCGNLSQAIESPTKQNALSLVARRSTARRCPWCRNFM